MVKIQFSHNQVGCRVDASTDGGKEWHFVQLLKYGSTLDTQRTEREYLNTLRAKKIEFEVITPTKSETE